MLFLIPLAALLQADTLDYRGVVRASVEHVIAVVGKQSASFSASRTIHIDVASFRKAAGLADDVPNKWRTIASAGGGKGDVRRSSDIWQCAPQADLRTCEREPAGEALVRAVSVSRSGGHLTVVVSVSWSASARDSYLRVFNVDFSQAGAGYTFNSAGLMMVH